MIFQTIKERENRILDFISLCNNTWGKYPEFSGGCYKFSNILIVVFGGDMYWSHDHIITVIDGNAYDIDGKAELTEDYKKVGSKDCPLHFIEKAYSEFI